MEAIVPFCRDNLADARTARFRPRATTRGSCGTSEIRKNISKDSKGQAAVTDSLFMLMVVTGLAITLFVFTANYGSSINDHILREYTIDYATDGLKAILYSSTPRLENESINIQNPGSVETDYLLAVIKEDYGDDQVLSEKTQNLIKNNIQFIMAPLGDQFDYMFFIVNTQNLDYAYLLIYKSEFLCSIGNEQPRECKLGERNVTITPGKPSHKFYLCNQSNNKITSQNIQEFIFSVGNTFQTEASMLLIESERTGNIVEPRPVPAKANLIIWPSTLITKQTMDLLNCKEFPSAP